MKSKLASVMDIIAFTFAAFLLGALICGYFTKSFVVILSAACAVAVITAALMVKKTKKLSLESKKEYYASLLSEFFMLHEAYFALDYFFTALSKRYKTELIDNYLRINNTLIFLCLSEPLSLKHTVACYAVALRQKAATLVILTQKCDKSVALAKNKLSDLRLDIFEQDRVYRLLNSLNSLPTLSAQKKKRSAVWLNALSPKRAKHYLFTAFVLLIGAFYSMYSLYFVISGGLCLTLALLSFVNIPRLLAQKKDAQSAQKV